MRDRDQSRTFEVLRDYFARHYPGLDARCIAAMSRIATRELALTDHDGRVYIRQPHGPPQRLEK